jgi:prolyl-tRNA synthetase
MEQLKTVLDKEKGIVRVLWCGRRECEDRMKEYTGGKIINIPLEQKGKPGDCISCGEKSKYLVNFAKSY